MNFSSFKPDTENNANFDAASSKCANFDELTRCNFFKHTPKFIIFGTHNLHTFSHNTLVNELLLMQIYLFNIRPKLHHHKWCKLRVTVFQTFSTSPAACWCCSSSNLYPETLIKTVECCNLYIHTDFWSKFCLLYWTAPFSQAMWRVIFTIRVIFGVRFERRKVKK